MLDLPKDHIGLFLPKNLFLPFQSLHESDEVAGVNVRGLLLDRNGLLLNAQLFRLGAAVRLRQALNRLVHLNGLRLLVSLLIGSIERLFSVLLALNI